MRRRAGLIAKSRARSELSERSKRTTNQEPQASQVASNQVAWQVVRLLPLASLTLEGVERVLKA